MSIRDAYLYLKEITVDLPLVEETVILNEVGRDGLELMLDSNLIECHGDINGRPLYRLIG